MAVIITDMDMPLDCGVCIFRDGVSKCGLTGELLYGVHNSDCPLKSTDEMIAEIKKLPNANPSYWNTCDVVDREDLLDIIHEYCDKERDHEMP